MDLMDSVGVDVYYAGDSLHIDMEAGADAQLSFIIHPSRGLLHAYYLGDDNGSGEGQPPEHALNMFRGMLPEEDYHV